MGAVTRSQLVRLGSGGGEGEVKRLAVALRGSGGSPASSPTSARGLRVQQARVRGCGLWEGSLVTWTGSAAVLPVRISAGNGGSCASPACVTQPWLLGPPGILLL